MRLRNVKNASDILNSSSYFLSDYLEHKGKFNEIFNNANPIHIEIGCGKGDFLIGMAEEFPNINFVGVEKYESVLVRAIQKIDTLKLNNIKFICCDAINLDQVFDREIAMLYLNFSDPWPKTRHEKRRLTSPDFLNTYDKIFKDDIKIKQKTDNIKLFAYSLVEYSKSGFILEEVSLDLHSEDVFNVETEYERKFSALNVKINYVYAVKYRKK